MSKQMKNVQCTKCAFIFPVEVTTTAVTCPNCGNKFKVAYLGKIGNKWL